MIERKATGNEAGLSSESARSSEVSSAVAIVDVGVSGKEEAPHPHGCSTVVDKFYDGRDFVFVVDLNNQSRSVVRVESESNLKNEPSSLLSGDYSFRVSGRQITPAIGSWETDME